MPVEIKELIVRTTIDKQNSTSNNQSANANNNCLTPSDKEQTQVQLDEILKLMKGKNER